jgi:hypothetical protein
VVPRASGPFFFFCTPGFVFGGTEVVRFSFHVLRSRTHFRRYRGRRVSFLCFALPDSFLAVPRAFGPVFMFCAPEHVFGGREVDGSRFHVLCARAHFRRDRGRSVPFSYFALIDMFSAVRRASGPVFMFCEPGLGRRVPFSFFAPELIFSGTKGVRTRIHDLPTWTRFRR